MGERGYLRIAHRGASGTRPEHTRVAFERALEIGVDMIELDVQLTRDRRLVVLHDRELGRTVAGRGLVREFRFEELRVLDAGGWFHPVYAGERVLSLDDVLDLTAHRVRLNVEIKSPSADWAETACTLVDLLESRGCLKSTVVSSFEIQALTKIRERSPRVSLGVLWRVPDLAALWQAARELGAASVHPHWSLVNAELVTMAHAAGLSVLVWTVNDTGMMHDLVRLGVDGIMSDFPERLP